jgi:basic membrane protein A
VKRSFRTVLALVVVFALATTVLAGCSAPAPTTTGTTPTEVKFKAGMVTDVGGLGDKSFNDAAYAGLKKAETELGVEIKALSSKAMTDYDSNIAQLANAKFNAIVCVGFLMQDAMSKAATAFPDVKFVGEDVFVADGAPGNELGVTFKEQEAGYLAGVVAGMLTKDAAFDKRVNADNVIGFVGGMPIPPVQRYEAGFIAGAKSVNPSIKVISLYAGATPQAFNDQAKGKELGLSLISQKADIVFAAAGQTGLGTIKACQEKNALFIGVDVDQFVSVAGSGDVMLTSAMKNMEFAIFDSIKAAKEGTFKGGTTKNYGIKEGGIELAPYHDFDSKVPQAVKDAVEKAKTDITNGTVVVPEDPKKA